MSTAAFSKSISGRGKKPRRSRGRNPKENSRRKFRNFKELNRKRGWKDLDDWRSSFKRSINLPRREERKSNEFIKALEQLPLPHLNNPKLRKVKGKLMRGNRK
jgi:hypothetical protein